MRYGRVRGSICQDRTLLRKFASLSEGSDGDAVYLRVILFRFAFTSRKNPPDFPRSALYRSANRSKWRSKSDRTFTLHSGTLVTRTSTGMSPELRSGVTWPASSSSVLFEGRHPFTQASLTLVCPSLSTTTDVIDSKPSTLPSLPPPLPTPSVAEVIWLTLIDWFPGRSWQNGVNDVSLSAGQKLLIRHFLHPLNLWRPGQRSNDCFWKALVYAVSVFTFARSESFGMEELYAIRY